MSVIRSPKANTLVLLGILAFFVIVGMIIWIRWDAAAASPQTASPSGGAALWGLVILGGPVILLAAFIWGKLHNRSATRAIDPATPSDDPSKGLPGHD